MSEASPAKLRALVREHLDIPKDRESAVEYQLALRRKAVLDEVETSPAPANRRWNRTASVLASLVFVALFAGSFFLKSPHQAVETAIETTYLMELETEELAMSLEFYEWLSEQHPENTNGSSGG